MTKTQNGRKTPAIFVNFKANTLLCTVHDIFGYRVPHVDVDIMTYDGLRLFKFLLRNCRVLEYGYPIPKLPDSIII